MIETAPESRTATIGAVARSVDFELPYSSKAAEIHKVA